MYLTHVDIDGTLIFVMVLPFEQKHLAKQNGFVWNNILPGAWAADNQATALAAVRANVQDIVIAQPTIAHFAIMGKIVPTTAEMFYERLAAYQPDRKMKAAIEAATMSDDMILAIHSGLQKIAGVCDGTLTEDEQGFNRNDVEYGHKLADKAQLTRTDAGYAKLLLYKYRRQLGADLYSVIFPDVLEREQQAEEAKANKKAAKAAEKFHKKGKACDWSSCQQCTQMPGVVQPMAVLEVDNPTLPASPAISELDAIIDRSEAARLAVRELKPLSDFQPQPEKFLKITMQNTAAPCTAETMASGYCTRCGEYHAQGMAVGSFDPVENIAVVTKPAAVTTVKLTDDQQAANPEIIRLATSLIDCFAGDFDTVVDALRELRGIDAPKEAKSESVKNMWQAAGYTTK